MSAWLAYAAAALGAAPPPVVGGRETDDFPFVGAFVASDGSYELTFCTGTLVGEAWVLTAAHCAESIDDFDSIGLDTEFRLGPDARTPEISAGWLERYVHPGYDPETFAEDVGLVLLDERLDLPVLDPNGRAVDAGWVGHSLVSVGYGDTEHGANDAGIKRLLSLDIVDVDSRFLYAVADGGQNLCSGDSGGPALVDLGGGEWGIAGTATFVYDPKGGAPICRDGGTAYLRSDRSRDWVVSTMEGTEEWREAWVSGTPLCGGGSSAALLFLLLPGLRRRDA